MTQRQAHEPHRDEAGTYEIRLAGHLGDRWAAWFDTTISQEGAGVTVLTGVVLDQAALHGLLQKVRDLGLPLISVQRIDNPTKATTTSDARTHVDHQGD